MDLRISDLGQPADGLTSASSNRTGSVSGDGNTPSSNATSSVSSDETQDTATISSAQSQLSGDLPVRQDRVSALRAQVESGTYTVDAHAVATAMFSNLLRS
jgi:flagellar biosynthesis anti-sigma factor FlgM